jgi:hypothetical protein
MESRQIRELTEDELSIFVMLEQNSNVDELFEQMKETDGGLVLKAIEKRFEAYEMNVDKKVMIAVLSIGDGVVGKCAKYVDDIAAWGNEFHHTKIEWNRFTREIYPFGISLLSFWNIIALNDS